MKNKDKRSSFGSIEWKKKIDELKLKYNSGRSKRKKDECK